MKLQKFQLLSNFRSYILFYENLFRCLKEKRLEISVPSLSSFHYWQLAIGTSISIETLYENQLEMTGDVSFAIVCECMNMHGTASPVEMKMNKVLLCCAAYSMISTPLELSHTRLNSFCTAFLSSLLYFSLIFFPAILYDVQRVLFPFFSFSLTLHASPPSLA